MITHLVKKSIKAVLGLLFHVKIKGNLKHLQHDKLIITPNHVSFLDGVLLGAYLPIKPVFAIYSGYIDHWLVKLFSRFVDFVPMDPADPMMVKHLVKEVEKGRPLVIFPEGRITVTGSLMKIYDGAAFIAVKSGATVVPIWISGAEFSMLSRLKGLFKRRLFPRITIHILDPQHIEMPKAESATQRRYMAGERLHQIMMQARMASRPKITLFEALLEAQIHYGIRSNVVKDISFKEDSYREFLIRILGISRIIEKFTAPKENVGVLLPNATITAATIMGLSVKNRIPAMLNYTAGVNSLRAAITATKMKSIITSRAFLDQGNLQHVITELQDITWHFLEDFRDQASFKDKLYVYSHTFIPRLLDIPQRADDPALILFTSGSEGTPKAVVHTHASLLANVEQIRTVLDPMPTDRFMSALPLFHAFGLTAGLFLPLLSGSKLFFYPNPLHYKVVPEIVYDQNCTILFGTPTFLTQYAKFAHPYDFMRLRYVVAGAEKLSEKTRELWMDKFGIRILEGYGVTECAPVIAINVPVAFKKGTVGRLLPGMQARIIPIDGIDDGGILHVRGPNVMKGYLRVENPGVLEKPAARNLDGQYEPNWYDTGDIVSIDAEQFMTIKGRFKRFAKIAGEMVSLEAVEKAALEIDPDAQHGVTLKADEGKGEALVLFTTSTKVTREAFNQVASELGLPALAVPRDIRHVESMPLLGSGKIDFVTLQQLADSQA